MKSLSLYVDKWFITVAINFDGNVLPLSLPNGEDRIWLFFHEDIANTKIEYGKNFENNYRDQLPHYFGDVFNLIEEGRHHFVRYEHRREEMKEIFKVAGIFNHLHQAVGDDGQVIDTYISFSSDIPYVARLQFIEELEDANFKVIESVARISHLALEECKKRNTLIATGPYLVMVATNDNFHFALYENTGNIFLRKSEGSLPGLGMDVRRRALVEAVVDNINKNTKLLNSQEEFDMECVRQDRFATEWLNKVAKGKPYIPVAIGEVTFAVAPNNPSTVQLLRTDLDNRTTGIVDDIVRKIAEFVRNNQIQPHELKGVVLIGNTFTNQTFTKAINSRFVVDQDKTVIYREEELPKVVSIYSQIDCTQFNGATTEFMNDAKTQAILNQQAKEEEEKKLKAQEEARRQQELIDQRKKDEREYKNAVENIERYESNHNYEEMLEWADIAIKICPDDSLAKEKLELARQQLADQKATNKQFNSVLQRAKTAFSEGRWSDVMSHCDMALELRADSEETLRLKSEARRQMEVKEKIQQLLNRADVFFAQKLYTEAEGEISKILSLDPTNQQAQEIKRKISEVHSQHQNKVNSLVERLMRAESEQNFELAIEMCDSLIEEDAENIRNWTVRRERINSKQKEIEDNKRKIADLKRDINKAHFEEDWNRLTVLCEAYLQLDSDRDISQLLLKAKKRIEEIRVKESKEKALANINRLILDGRFNEAKKELDRFAQGYPSEESTIKDLRKKLFASDSDFGGNSMPNPPRNPIGFGTKPSVQTCNGNDDSTVLQKPAARKPSKIESQKTSGKDDFFDKSSSQQPKQKDTKTKYTNNDFNF